MLSLTQLETFRRLALEGNFTRTAEALDITQPAVTQQLRVLQAHFGIALIDVVGRRTVFTDAGRFLAERAESLLGAVHALERDMREFAGARAGELRIGATVTIGTYGLPEIVARFRAAYPALRLHVEVGNTDAMALAVKEGRVAVALIEGPLVDADLAIEAYADDELLLIAPPEHPLARRKTLASVRDLAAVPFVSREEGSGTRAFAIETLVTAGVEPQVVLALPTGEAIVRAVQLGIGVAIVSRLVATDALAAGRVARIRLRDLSWPRSLRIVRLRRQTPSPAALAFVALLRGDRAGT